MNIGSNILVNNNRAIPARSVDQIREILGVRASDNLRHAELVLVVEGDEDKLALKAMMKSHSTQLAEAIESGKLAIETLAGGSNLSYVVGMLRDALLCSFHCFLDNDLSGRDSFEKAKKIGLVDVGDVNFASVPSMNDSELEDLYDLPLYRDLVWNQYTVNLDIPKFKTNKKKWSDRVGEIFKVSGKAWDDGIKMALKAKLAELVASNSAKALNPHKRGVIDNLCETLLVKLDSLHTT